MGLTKREPPNNMIIDLTKAKLKSVEIALTMVPGCYLTDRPGAPILRRAHPSACVWVPCVRLHFETGAGIRTKTYHPSIKD